MKKTTTTTTPGPRASRSAVTVAALSALAFLAVAVWNGAAQGQGTVEFERDVWPIFQAKCVTCHGPEDQFNELRLDSKDRILRGGKNGKVLAPGDPDRSPLFVRVNLPPDDLDIMPAEGDPLNGAQIDTLRRWIAEGAEFGSWTGPG